MRNRCSFFFFRYIYRSRGPYLPHLQPPVIDKVTIDVEERDRLRTMYYADTRETEHAANCRRVKIK